MMLRCQTRMFTFLVAFLSVDALLVNAQDQDSGFGIGALFHHKEQSNPRLSTSSPIGDAARYLDSSAKVIDSVIPGEFAEKLLPKLQPEEQSNPRLPASSPIGDASRYLDVGSSFKLFDSGIPGQFAGGLFPKFQHKQQSDPRLSTSSPEGDAARYLDSSVSLFDAAIPGEFAEKLIPKFDDKKDQVCYEYVGCFSNRDRLTHPTSFPSDPSSVNTKFELYSRSNRRSPVRLDYRPNTKLGRLPQFDQRKPLKLIVHGFLENGKARWMQDIKDALLDLEDCNVIIVDWSGGAQQLSYIKASGNTALVGREASLLVQRLIETHRNTLSVDQVHIIGFSLGGQIAGFFGRHFKQTTGKLIPRITGLDPAGPLFDKTNVCLSDKDARFVDTIHTSGGDAIVVGELGIDRPVGHVDYYPNGGKMQPGCKPLDIPCDHFRAPAYFLESLRNKQCRFVSNPCQGGFRALEQKRCQPRGQRGLMGYFSDTVAARGVQTLITNAKSEYCKA